MLEMVIPNPLAKIRKTSVNIEDTLENQRKYYVRLRFCLKRGLLMPDC